MFSKPVTSKDSHWIPTRQGREAFEAATHRLEVCFKHSACHFILNVCDNLVQLGGPQPCPVAERQRSARCSDSYSLLFSLTADWTCLSSQVQSSLFQLDRKMIQQKTSSTLVPTHCLWVLHLITHWTALRCSVSLMSVSSWWLQTTGTLSSRFTFQFRVLYVIYVRVVVLYNCSYLSCVFLVLQFILPVFTIKAIY